LQKLFVPNKNQVLVRLSPAQANLMSIPPSTDQCIPSNGPDSPNIPVLSAKGLCKDFGPVRVLDDINLDFAAGEIHAVVGENGAGKSTLVKILAGALEPTAGTVLFKGTSAPTGNLRAMEHLGVRFIHQELNLAEDLSVQENLFLGQELRRGIFLDERAMRRKGSEVLAQVGARVNLDVRVGRLRISEKQMVEIAKAISRQATVIIFDEPTAVLTLTETDRLFQLIESFARTGVAIIYISHRLEEVKRLAHRITILRDGRQIATRRAGEISPDEIARLMVGRSLQDLFPPKRIANHEPVRLEVRGLTIPEYASDCSFVAKRGEIVGFSGLVGAGRTELFEGVVGLRGVKAGQILRDGQPVEITDYPAAIHELRAVYLPEDRKGKGLIVSFDARTNFSLLSLQKFGNWFVNERRESAAFQEAVRQFQIKIPDRSMPANRLSGGNQQKVVLAKISAIDPEILILDEPTRGIDIGTKAQIYHWIADLAARGLICIVISSELPEIIGLCHRVIVMRSSRIVANLEGDLINEDEIMLYATGVKPRMDTSKTLTANGHE
jgi:ribose transport system ATP-binding protein